MSDNPEPVEYVIRVVHVDHRGHTYPVRAPEGIPKWFTVLAHRWEWWRRCMHQGHQNMSLPGICPRCGTVVGFGEP